MVFIAGRRLLCVGQPQAIQMQAKVGRHCHTPASDYNSDQLRKGILTQLEHTNTPAIAQQIAKDHLSEVPDYYTRLSQMQQQAMGQQQIGAPPIQMQQQMQMEQQESKDEEADDTTFAPKLERKKLKGLVFVFFYMSHCPHCRRMMPTVESMVQRMPNLYLMRCDIKRCPNMQKYMQVQSAPTSFLMKGGQWADRIDGAVPDEELQQRILALV